MDTVENELKEPFEEDHASVQFVKNETLKEKSIKITIRVPSRLNQGKKSNRHRAEIQESITETESEELSSLSDLEEDEEIVIDESQDTDDAETFVPTPHSKNNLSNKFSKLTKRQRARIDEDVAGSSNLMQLPETVRRRHQNLTEEELALKKDELARRRKNLSEQKLEEEKMETIHKLLNKQATHKYKRIRTGDTEGISDDEKNVSQASSPIMSRWLNTKAGTVLAIPRKWLDTNVSVYFTSQKAPDPPLPQPSCASFIHNTHCTDNNCYGICQTQQQQQQQQQQHGFPRVPSFSYNEKHNYTPLEENQNNYTNYQTFQMNYVPPDRNVPYLLLPARLSLIWVNKCTIAMILIFIRLFFFMLSFKKDINIVEEKMQDAYTIMQHSANALAIMPRLTAIGANKMIALGMENSVQALNKALLFALIGVENIILFFIDMLIRTWVCLLELTIKGGINIIADVVEKITKFVNSALHSIEKDIVNGIQEVNKGLSSILVTVERTMRILGKKVNLPPLTISSVDKLANVTIPTNYDDELRKLQHKISLDPVKDITKKAIIFPFSELRKLINSTLSNYSFDASLLPVPSENEFIAYKDNRQIRFVLKKFSDDVFNTIHIILIIIIALAILAVIPSAIKEWWDWRRLQSKAAMVWSIFSITKTFDPAEFILTITHPWSTLLGVKFSQNFKDWHRKILTRWFLSYIFHPSSLFVLGLGILGAIGCGLQFLLLLIMKKNLPISLSEVNMLPLITENFQETSSKWSDDVNIILNKTNTNINNLLFRWVYHSTRSINGTMNAFVSTTKNTLMHIFGGTILYKPVLDTLNCLLFIKLKAIEKGLTWVHENARISLPSIPKDILISSESSLHTDFINTSKSLNQKFYSLLNTLVHSYEKSIIFEAKISLALISAWVLIFIMALIRVIFSRRPAIRGMGGGTHSKFPPKGTSHYVYKDDTLYDYLPSRPKQYNVNISREMRKSPVDFSKAPYVPNNNIMPPVEPGLSGGVVEQYKWRSDNTKKHYNEG
ncbi:hypothetical protein PCANB_002290 [Pneumocystis canis]|nr:hypothetical protein PCK1_002242 [Pneumocystis canis]KAG5438960.1 hypothetical protein PCANB_002290 [Pneumocystis canis]